MDCFVAFAPRNGEGGHCPVMVREADKISSLTFVDRIFTTSLQAQFTNAFDVMAANADIA
jgi:hypothetical protein